MHFCPPCGNLLLLEVRRAAALLPGTLLPYCRRNLTNRTRLPCVPQNANGRMRYYCQTCPYIYTLKKAVRASPLVPFASLLAPCTHHASICVVRGR